MSRCVCYLSTVVASDRWEDAKRIYCGVSVVHRLGRWAMVLHDDDVTKTRYFRSPPGHMELSRCIV
jgi:hypothetical protein